MPDFQHLSVQHVDGVTVVQVLTPKLSDSLTVSEFQDELLEMIEADLLAIHHPDQHWLLEKLRQR